VTGAPLTRRQVLALAWPVVLAQAATAATGVVDTAAIGLVGVTEDIAAVAIASVVFSFVYWGFGFLRMATTGLTAQATGAGDHQEAHATLLRALLLGGGLGTLLLLFARPIEEVALLAFEVTPRTDDLSREYFRARIGGAPAALMLYGITGYLLGRGRTQALLAVQVAMNLVNAVLDAVFVVALDWGPAGIGVGTAIAEWTALLFGAVLVRRALRGERGPLLDRQRLVALFAANRDIMIRTLALLTSFAWFTRSGTTLGTATVAGNQVLLQFVSVAAFVLDGFAFLAEKEAGEAFGAKDPARLRRAMRVTTELAFGFALAFALLFYFGGDAVITALVEDDDTRRAALAYLPYCAAVPLVGVFAFQLDGIFLGTTQGPAVRNAGVIAAVLYVASDVVLRGALDNHGVWLAFLAMYVLRAAALGAYLPRLMRATRAAPEQS